MQEGRAAAAEGASRARRMAARLRLMLGLRRSFVVDGIRYTERSTEPLRRSLSRKGIGLKEYDAVFPDGAKLRLHCTPARVYADVTGALLLPRYRVVEDLLSPGMRALELGCGTGYGAAWLLERVGPSGAVVALDRDRESVKYAQRRYQTANAAFEQGGVETLYGELAGGFDAVLALRGVEAQPGLEATLRELWRVVAPGGWLLVSEPVEAAAGGESIEAMLRRITADSPPRAEGEEAEPPERPDHTELEHVVTRLDEAGPVWLVMKADA